jgi:hypothetical protein
MKKTAKQDLSLGTYITDARGKRMAVVIPIERYDELMEDLQDLAIIADRKDEPGIPYEEFRKQLKKHFEKTGHFL